MDDEPAVRCMVDVLRGIRFEASSKADRDLCGLVCSTTPSSSNLRTETRELAPRTR